MAKIYIASREVNGVPANGGEHSFWVYDPDGTPDTGDEEIIRGGPTDNVDPSKGYVIETGRAIEDSRDALDPDQDPYADHNYTTAAEGTEAEIQAKWDQMVTEAKKLGNEIDDPDGKVDENGNPLKVTKLPENDYNIFAVGDPNCHCVTSTVGRAGGFDVENSLPKKGGDLGTGGPPIFPEIQFVGIDTIIGTTGDDTQNLNAGPSKYYDQGGEDTYFYDPSNDPDPDKPIYIYEDSNSSTADRLEILGVNPEDVGFMRGANGDLLVFLPGDITQPSIVIKDQFDDGFPKMNTLWAYPPGGGPPQVIPLNNPDDFPFWVPPNLPDWVPVAKAPFDSAPDQESPLVLDLDGDGIELTALDGVAPTTFFDIDHDGFAEATGWVAPDDGLLARDLDGNGTIDNAGELFGSSSVDGFALLQELDSNGDLVIDQHDSAWGELRVWQDANGDGVTQAGELQDLASYNIASIDLAGVAPSTQVIAGNSISHNSTFSYDDGTTGSIVDAWFSVDQVRSYALQDYTPTVAVLSLPTLRGFGDLADLRYEMSENTNLLNQVYNFALNWSFGSFADAQGLREDIEGILFEWAGTADPATILPHDPEYLQFLEAQFGAPVRTNTWDAIMTGWQAIDQSWYLTFNNLKAHLLVQVGAHSLFANPVTYNPVSGMIEGELSLSQSAVDGLIAHATAPGVNAQSYWVEVAEFLQFAKGYENFTAIENQWMDDAVSASDATLTWQGIRDLTAYDNPPLNVWGTDASETLHGTAGDNEMRGFQGDDVLYGYEGNDVLWGGPVFLHHWQRYAHWWPRRRLCLWWPRG